MLGKKNDNFKENKNLKLILIRKSGKKYKSIEYLTDINSKNDRNIITLEEKENIVELNLPNTVNIDKNQIENTLKNFKRNNKLIKTNKKLKDEIKENNRNKMKDLLKQYIDNNNKEQYGSLSKTNLFKSSDEFVNQTENNKKENNLFNSQKEEKISQFIKINIDSNTNKNLDIDIFPNEKKINKETEYENIIESKNILKNKNIIKLNTSSNSNQGYRGLYIIKKLKRNDTNLDEEEEKKDNLNIKKNFNYIITSTTKKGNSNIKTNKFRICMNDKEDQCFICEKPFISYEIIYCAECNIHLMCKSCAKNYYQQNFENNNITLKCPDYNCQQIMDYSLIKNILNQEYQDLLEKKNEDNKILRMDLNNKIISRNYSEKHVIDINSNRQLYIYEKNKDIYCFNCMKPSLYGGMSKDFLKCLNCHKKICKFCFKEYKDNHMNKKNEDRCKVYFRRKTRKQKKINICIKFFYQLFFIIAMFLMIFIGTFLYINKFLIFVLRINNIKGKFFLNTILKIFTFIIFLCFIPFIYILLPYFPNIASLCDI